MSANPPHGTRVRVTFEGVVSSLSHAVGSLHVAIPDSPGLWTAPPTASVEVVLPTPRQFENGDLYYSPVNDSVYRYGALADRFKATGNGPAICRDVASDEWLGQLIRLVPEAKVTD